MGVVLAVISVVLVFEVIFAVSGVRSHSRSCLLAVDEAERQVVGLTAFAGASTPFSRSWWCSLTWVS